VRQTDGRTEFLYLDYIGLQTLHRFAVRVCDKIIVIVNFSAYCMNLGEYNATAKNGRTYEEMTKCN